MHKPASVRSLETLGRVHLSRSFFMRDFLHSEIANFYGVPNIPEDPDQAIAAGAGSARNCSNRCKPPSAGWRSGPPTARRRSMRLVTAWV